MLRLLPLIVALACSPAASDVAAESAEPVTAAESTADPDPVREAQAQPATAFDQRHAAWTAVLAEHVQGDRFDYGAVKKDRKALDAYLRSLEAVTAAELASWTEKQRFAFWVNVYNAYTVDLVVDAYPVASIRDIGSLMNRVWDKEFIPLQKGLRPDGKPGKLSLNQVEHEILRKRFDDARVHAAVNCASESCPPLRAEAFTAKQLDTQLDEQVRLWLADKSRNLFHASDTKLEVSEIFKWFAEDFERDAGSVQKWIARYAPTSETWLANKPDAKLCYLEYSWRLNDVRAD